MHRFAAAATAAVAVIAVAAAPGSARTSTKVDSYRVTQASGFVRITFQGDQSAGCADAGVCGVSGVTTFRYHGRPKKSSFEVLSRGGSVMSAFGRFQTGGETTSRVATAGSPDTCTDTVKHRNETIALERKGSRLHFIWHGDRDNDSADFLRTRCAGLGERDLRDADVLPFGDFSPGLFTHHDVGFGTGGNGKLKAGGFAGAVEWDLKYAVSRRGCSPNC